MVKISAQKIFSRDFKENYDMVFDKNFCLVILRDTRVQTRIHTDKYILFHFTIENSFLCEHCHMTHTQQGCLIWAQSESDWPQMGQNQNSVHFWLALTKPKCTEI